MPEQEYFTRLRKFEGFNPKPYGDYKQTSIGYGTRARPGETFITPEEGERRLQSEVGHARGLVRGFGAKLSPHQEWALTDLTYNAGPSWMQGRLGSAVRAGNWQEAGNIYRQYNKAGGQTLPGLVSRREAMVPWLLNASGEASPAGGQSMTQPQPVWGMIKRPQPQPTADASGIGAISPEHMRMMGQMGLLRGRQQAQPRNVGEALGQLGDMWFDHQTRRWAIEELRKGTAAENQAWAQYGGGGPSASGAPSAGAPPGTPPATPPVPGGMITAGRSFGTNPSPAPEMDPGRPAIGGGMITAGANWDRQRVMSEDMAPPPMAPGMINPQMQPVGAPVTADARRSMIDAQEAEARRLISSGHPALRERGLALIDDARKRRYEIEDPMAAAELDFKRAQAEKARREATKGGKRSLNPTWGKDKDGNDVLLQLGDEGDATRTALPPDVSVSPGNTTKVDLGTHWGILDRTGTLIGRLPKDVAGEASAKEEGKAQGQAKVDLGKVEQAAKSTLGYIEQIERDPNLPSVTGWQGYLPTWRSSSIDTEERIKQLEGRAFLSAFESLKGGGQITEMEGQKASAALSRLQNLKQSDAGYREALKDFRREVEDLVAIARRRAGGGGAAPAGPAADPLGIR